MTKIKVEKYLGVRFLRPVMTGVLVASVAVATVSHAGELLKQGAESSYATSADEEMVAGFIVKPHRWKGKKLGAALESHDARTLSAAAKMPMRVARAMSGDAHVIRTQKPIRLSEARVIAARMMREGSVELAEPDRIMYPATFTPSDPFYGSHQWHYMAPGGTNLGGANLPAAWDITKGSNGITVAVLDTGNRSHEDLNSVLQGHDFITNTTIANDGDGRDTDAQDPGDWLAANECGDGGSAHNSSWHGTHVTGTIAALMNNGKGGTGIAPNVKILPLRIIGKCGGTTSDIVDAMRWAAGISVPGAPVNPNVAQVLNMSLGGAGSCSSAFQSAVNDVVNAGKIIVVAAGNNASSSLSQPANCTGVLAVTAHAVDGDNARYANIAPEVFISAPGGGCGTLTSTNSSSPRYCASFSTSNGLGVLSNGNSGATTPGGDNYSLKMGTSMATPHVSGTIALMLSLNPSLTPTQIKAHLQSSVRPHPPGSTCTLSSNVGKCGKGLLNAGAAVASVAAGVGHPLVSVTSASQLVAPSAQVALSGSAEAALGSTIQSYSWTASPSNPTSVTLTNGNTQNASFTAPGTGTYAFTLTATDSQNRVGSAGVVVKINTAPTLNAVTSQSVVAGAALNFSLSASDPDGDALIFHSLSLPDGASLSPSGTFTWDSATPAGSYQVSYYVSDNYADSSKGTVSVAVTAPASSGGGGGMDDASLIGLALLALGLRMRRASLRRTRA